jgi:hypothetical protein
LDIRTTASGIRKFKSAPTSETFAEIKARLTKLGEIDKFREHHQ